MVTRTHACLRFRVPQVVVAAGLACIVPFVAFEACGAPLAPPSLQTQDDSRPLLLAQGIGVLAPALAEPVDESSGVMLGELPPCAPAAVVPPGQADGAGPDDSPAAAASGGAPGSGPAQTSAGSPGAMAQGRCGGALDPSTYPTATDPSTFYSLDYDGTYYTGGGKVAYARPLGVPKTWFTGASTPEGLYTGARSLGYRTLDGPALTLGSIAPSATTWTDPVAIGGLNVSDMPDGNGLTLPAGAFGYSSTVGRLDNTDPTATQGGLAYGATAATGSLRYGLSPGLTLESQMQTAPAMTVMGLGSTYAAGDVGTFSAGASQSRFDELSGWRYRLGYTLGLTRYLNLGVANERSAAGYGDLSTYSTGALATGQSRNSLTAGIPMGTWGTLSGTYTGTRDANGTLAGRSFGLMQSWLLAPNVTFAVGADRDVITGDYDMRLQLSLPMGR
jgi:hypothetical protein